MSQPADDVDLGRLELRSGQGRTLEFDVAAEPFDFGGQRYAVVPATVPVRLEVSRMTGSGYAMRVAFSVTLQGPCMRCLGESSPAFSVEAREVDQPGGGEELCSPYVIDSVLDLRAWVRDALGLALPAQILCRADCAGLCPECGADLNAAGPEHAHERPPDPRWAALRGLDLGQ